MDDVSKAMNGDHGKLQNELKKMSEVSLVRLSSGRSEDLKLFQNFNQTLGSNELPLVGIGYSTLEVATEPVRFLLAANEVAADHFSFFRGRPNRMEPVEPSDDFLSNLTIAMAQRYDIVAHQSHRWSQVLYIELLETLNPGSTEVSRELSLSFFNARMVGVWQPPTGVTLLRRESKSVRVRITRADQAILLDNDLRIREFTPVKVE